MGSKSLIACIESMREVIYGPKITVAPIKTLGKSYARPIE